jgi:alkylation response protein AidB-like acyl-CoA dehydrogenase
MDFGLTPEQEILKKTVRAFLDKECPGALIRQWEENEYYPYELFRKMADLGWLGILFPPDLEGSGGSRTDFAILSEELAFKEFEIASSMGLSVMCGMNVLHKGTPGQIKCYIPRIIRGEIRFSISITEPNAGSDAASLSTRAHKNGDHYVLNGQKLFCTGADLDNTIIQLAARTDPNAKKHNGISIFFIDPSSPNVTVRRLKTLGRRIQGTCEIFLDDVEVGEDEVLGMINEGWQVLASNLEFERALGAICYVGAAQSAVRDATQYAKQREQFGRTIGSFQSIAHMLADMQTEVDAARLMAYRAVWMADTNVPCLKEVCMAKLNASETYARVANMGMQILGGYGYMMEYDMQRHFRLARLATIGAGTSQIQRDIIARKMGLGLR